VKVRYYSEQRRLLTSILVTAALGAPIGAAPAAPVIFDSDGDGPNAATSVSVFDWAPGNALAIGGAAVPGEGSLTLLGQTYLAAFLDEEGAQIGSAELNQDNGFELTLVLGFGETAFDEDQQGTTTFEHDPDSPVNYFEVYWDPMPNADDLSGTGFDDGTLILAGTVVSSSGSFMLTTQPVNFDQFSPGDEYPGLESVAGTGTVAISIMAEYAHPDFFPEGVPAEVLVNGSQIAPFTQVAPSARFSTGLNGTSDYFVPALGAVNGLSGPDFQIQTDATMSFQ
jgi:hypothetical protein